MDGCMNKKTNKASWYDWFSLSNRDICNQYKVIAGKKFLETFERPSLIDKYENFVTAKIEAANEFIATKSRVNSV